MQVIAYQYSLSFYNEHGGFVVNDPVSLREEPDQIVKPDTRGYSTLMKILEAHKMATQQPHPLESTLEASLPPDALIRLGIMLRRLEGKES